MARLNLFRWVAVLTLEFALAIAPAPRTASAQDADTLDISGTFNMEAVREYEGTVGEDLAAVFARGNEHWWRLTLQGVSFSYDSYYYEWSNEFGDGYESQFITRVHATSFDFEFFGPDADVLNEVVSQQLTMSSTGDDVFLELRNGDYFDPIDHFGGGPYASWNIGLVSPADSSGVSFFAGSSYIYPLLSDEFGYPSVAPQRTTSQRTLIGDFRPGNSGTLESYDDAVDIGSAGPPNVPPPPPTLKIEDASGLEGDRGTTRLLITVKLSRMNDDLVAVNYQTVNGTASSKKDYTSASGTLTFLPGERERTIVVSLKADRQPEANETFTVRLSNAVGATITDDVATATILNDD